MESYEREKIRGRLQFALQLRDGIKEGYAADLRKSRCWPLEGRTREEVSKSNLDRRRAQLLFLLPFDAPSTCMLLPLARISTTTSLRQLQLHRILTPITMSSAQSISTTPSKTAEEIKVKSTSSVKSQLPHELNSVLRDEEWGTRVLKDEEEVFTLNAW